MSEKDDAIKRAEAIASLISTLVVTGVGLYLALRKDSSSLSNQNDDTKFIAPSGIDVRTFKV